jgi:hypothetical protein
MYEDDMSWGDLEGLLGVSRTQLDDVAGPSTDYMPKMTLANVPNTYTVFDSSYTGQCQQNNQLYGIKQETECFPPIEENYGYVDNDCK